MKTRDTKNTGDSFVSSEKETVDFSKPRSMVDQIYKDLGRAIARGDLAPGTLLKETELQGWFGVSRAPIREAIRLLESDDLVVVDAYKTKYVRIVTRSYLEDLIPVMACLEGYGGSLAAKNLTVKQIDSLKKINKNMEIAYRQKKYDLCAELNFDFHRVYIKSASNQVLSAAIRALKKSVVWFWLTNFVYKRHEVIPLSISEHDLIIQEFLNRDAKKAEEIVRNHIVNILERSIKSSYFDSKGFPILDKKAEAK